MFPFYDLMRQAQGGAAFDNIARAYGVDPSQMRAAMAALTPAFAQGFQRQSRNDEAARRLHDMFGAEVYARAFEAQAAALDPSAKAAGDDALGALFGSKEVSRAVAAQASAASGVQAEIIRKVLPVLTSILIGGFMKATQGAGGAPSSPSFPGAGPFGQFWEQILSGAQDKAAPEEQPAPEQPANPFQSWIDAFSGGASAREGRDGPANPMGDMMADILSGAFGKSSPEPKPETEPQAEAAPESEGDRAAEPGADTAFDQMMQTGREIQAHNARAMEQIFDAFFSGSARPRG